MVCHGGVTSVCSGCFAFSPAFSILERHSPGLAKPRAEKNTTLVVSLFVALGMVALIIVILVLLTRMMVTLIVTQEGLVLVLKVKGFGKARVYGRKIETVARKVLNPKPKPLTSAAIGPKTMKP